MEFHHISMANPPNITNSASVSRYHKTHHTNSFLSDTLNRSIIVQTYIRDLFLFIFVVLTAVAATYTMRKGRAPTLVNRPQTEEWKGWMQVLFLLYHYYEAKEAYNAIRVFIASYVWMTGFGNFSYYYKTRDFSLGRFAQMMWRLNMLVILVCAALNNSYMLYYICPMHTLFTVMVYAALGLWRKGLDSATGVWLKLAGCVVVTAVVWEYKAVFYVLWRPFLIALRYDDPRRPGPDPMHEWYFRSGLDRYIWIHGMVCAYLHPSFESALKGLEEAGTKKRRVIKAVLVAVTVAVGVVWWQRVFRLPKLEYNALHPFTSWIPITCE
jgi:N-acetylneuraminate 9-O-acetyltransferase